MIVIGHRGAAGLAPENTLSSFQKAIESNVDMIETDLRLLNGQIVLSHDRVLPGMDYPTLGELLSIADRPLNLELKESGFEQQLLEKLKGFAHKVLITSSNPWVLKKIRTLDTNILLGPVVGRRYGFFLPIVISLLKNINISSITLDVSLTNEQRMSKFHQLGWKVYVYTNDDAKIFNDPKVFQRLKDLGVDGIFADYPNIVSQYNLL